MLWQVLFRNFRAQWPYKLVGVPVFLGLFFLGYFYLIRFPRFPVRVMPRIWFDESVGVHGAALPLYLSLWIYTVAAVGLIATKRGLSRFLFGATAISLAGFFFFYFWPTAVPPLPDLPDAGRSPVWLAKVDAAGNACPSLHVAFVVFSAGWILFKLRGNPAELAARWLALLWGAGIIYSTIATGQHVALDVAAGAILGALGLWAFSPHDLACGNRTRGQLP